MPGASFQTGPSAAQVKYSPQPIGDALTRPTRARLVKLLQLASP